MGFRNQRTTLAPEGRVTAALRRSREGWRSSRSQARDECTQADQALITDLQAHWSGMAFIDTTEGTLISDSGAGQTILGWRTEVWAAP
jgi:hypothetical protein